MDVLATSLSHCLNPTFQTGTSQECVSSGGFCRGTTHLDGESAPNFISLHVEQVSGDADDAHFDAV